MWFQHSSYHHCAIIPRQFRSYKLGKAVAQMDCSSHREGSGSWMGLPHHKQRCSHCRLAHMFEDLMGRGGHPLLSRGQSALHCLIRGLSCLWTSLRWSWHSRLTNVAISLLPNHSHELVSKRPACKGNSRRPCFCWSSCTGSRSVRGYMPQPIALQGGSQQTCSLLACMQQPWARCT